MLMLHDVYIKGGKESKWHMPFETNKNIHLPTHVSDVALEVINWLALILWLSVVIILS